MFNIGHKGHISSKIMIANAADIFDAAAGGGGGDSINNLWEIRNSIADNIGMKHLTDKPFLHVIEYIIESTFI